MITTTKIRIRDLPERLHGMRVLQVSDLHMTRRSQGRERRMVELLREVECDLVLLTGDFVNRGSLWGRLGPWLALALPDAPRFAVPGNWDHRTSHDLREMREALDEGGVEVLVNESCRLRVKGEPVAVVGVDDLRFGEMDVGGAFAGVEAGALRLVMSHSPDILLHLEPGQFDLMVCGHTHGGQICIPGYGAILTSTQLGKRFEAGAYPVQGDGTIYVSRGIGTGYVPFRFWCPPELALLELQPILHPSQHREESRARLG